MSPENTINDKTTTGSPNTDVDTATKVPAHAELTPVETDGLTAGSPPKEAAPFDTTAGELALQLVLPNLRKIALSEVRRRHITAPSLTSAGLVYAANYAEDRPIFEAAFKKDGFDVTAFDDMRERAVAYWHLCLSVRQNLDIPIKLLLLEAKPLRVKLARAAYYLWGNSANLGDIVAGIGEGRTYFDQADDLGALAKLFTDNWAAAEGNCEVTKEDVLKARNVGEKFLENLGRMKSEEITELKALRLQAGEYLVRGINKMRIAAAFVFDNNETRLSRYPRLSVMKRKRTGSNSEIDEDVDFEEITENETESMPAPPALVAAPVSNASATPAPSSVN